MSIAQRYQALKAAPLVQRSGRLYSNASYERWEIPDPSTVKNQTNLYEWHTWIQDAIEKPSEMASGVPFNVLQMVGEETKPIRNHDFEQRLMRPNELHSRFELLVGTFSWLMASGNCYWWLNAPNEQSAVDEIWIIPAYQIVPVPDGNMGIKGYAYSSGDSAQPIPLEPWEIVHFKKWNPSNKYVGLSPLKALAMDAKGDLAAQKFNTSFYDKDNAKMSGILAFADSFTKPGEWERMVAQRDEKHGGTKHNRIMMLRGVGTGNVNWLPTHLTQVDIQYLQQRQFTKEEIYDRLAPGLASALAINSNEANSRTGQANLREMCIYPMHMAIAETIAMKILPRYGDNLTAEFEDVRHKDRQLELAEIQEYARTHTIDQVNKRWYGDDPLPDGRGTLFVAEVAKGMTDTRAPEDKPAPVAPTFGQPAQPSPDAILEAGKQLDLKRWQKKAINEVLKGRAPDTVVFDPDYLSDGETMPIRGALKKARTAEDVQAIFKKASTDDLDALLDDVFDEALRIAGEV